MDVRQWHPEVLFDGSEHNTNQREFFMLCGVFDEYVRGYVTLWEKNVKDLNKVALDSLVDRTLMKREDAYRLTSKATLWWVLKTSCEVKEDLSQVLGRKIEQLPGFDLDEEDPDVPSEELKYHQLQALQMIGEYMQEAYKHSSLPTRFLDCNKEQLGTKEFISKNSMRDIMRFGLEESIKPWQLQWQRTTLVVFQLLGDQTDS